MFYIFQYYDSTIFGLLVVRTSLILNRSTDLNQDICFDKGNKYLKDFIRQLGDASNSS